ncbi:MAG: hypothetical protein U0574_10700 [Phycisphaerales bacterium]
MVVCQCADAFSDLQEFEVYDNFSSPTEAHPRLELLEVAEAAGCAIFPQPPHYDDPFSCECFGETIDTGSLTCLHSASLEIGVRPNCTIFDPQNDWLHLGLVDGCGGPSFAWSKPMATLAAFGAISPPLAPGVTSKISLVLDALPPDANLVTNIME